MDSLRLRIRRWQSIRLLFVLVFGCGMFSGGLAAQETKVTFPGLAPLPGFPTFSSLNQQTAPASPSSQDPGAPGSTGEQQKSAKPDAETMPPPANPQPQRILGIMPNFRAVSAGVIPPPPTPKQAFVIATKNSFDYSSFVFVGITSLLAEGTNTHPQLGKGVPGFGSYYWRGFADKTDGNYLVIFALPSIFHQDERYYSLGQR